MPGEALKGLRVLEIGEGLPTAYCGRQFALWGADVAVIEGPAGSPLRRSAPRVGGQSLTWEYVAAGKRSVAVAADDLFNLASRADVLILDRYDRAAALRPPARTCGARSDHGLDVVAWRGKGPSRAGRASG